MLESKLYACIKKNVKDFLAEAVANVVSVGFRHLCKNDLEESESKDFAAKNIFLNIHSIIKETIKAVTEHRTWLLS